MCDAVTPRRIDPATVSEAGRRRHKRGFSSALAVILPTPASRNMEVRMTEQTSTARGRPAAPTAPTAADPHCWDAAFAAAAETTTQHRDAQAQPTHQAEWADAFAKAGT